MFDEFRIHMFSLKKNVLCKKLFDVPLVDYGVDGIGEIFQPSELSQLSRISNFSGSPYFPALPTLLDLPFFRGFGLSELFQLFDD